MRDHREAGKHKEESAGELRSRKVLERGDGSR